jgi:hypothetical protein
MNLAVGSEVTIKVENVMWPRRAAYAFPISEFNTYTGTIVHEKWFGPDQIGLTTGQKTGFTFRVIEKKRIVEVNGKKSAVQTPKKSPILQIEVAGSKGSVYQVVQDHNGTSCTCPGYKFRGACKHLELLAA